MTDQQRKIVLAGAILLVIMTCATGALGSLYVAQRILLPRVVGPERSGSVIGTDESSQQGLLVLFVDPNGPASRAGVRRGDIILSLDGHQLETAQELQRMVQSHVIGDTLLLEILRDGQNEAVNVTLGHEGAFLGLRVVGPEETSQLPPESVPPAELPDTHPPIEDIPAMPQLPFNLIQSRPLVSAVIPDSPAEAAGIQPGDLLTNVDDKAVLTTEELISAVGSHAPGEKVTVILRRGAETIFLEVTLDQHPENPQRGFLGVDLQSGIPPAPVEP